MGDGIIEYEDGITVGELAEMIGQTPANVIKVLFMLGTMVTINSSLNDEQVELICLEYGYEVKKKVIVSEINFEDIEIIDDEDFFEEEDPREALVAQLLEYRKFKYAATVLHEKEEERKLYYTKEPMDMDDYKEEDTTLPPNQIKTIDLFLAFHAMLEKKKNRQPVETTVASDDVSIEEKITAISERMRQVQKGKAVSFDSFFDSYSKQEIVTTFMALLELMKTGVIYAEQENNYSEILLFNTETQQEDTTEVEETQ